MNAKTICPTIVLIVLFIIVLLMMKMHRVEKVKIIDILNDPRKYEGIEVIVEGRYYGWTIPQDLPGPPDSSPPETRSDWIVADDTGWIYVTARGARIANVSFGQEIFIRAVVKTKNKNGVVVPYLYPIEVRVQ